MAYQQGGWYWDPQAGAARQYWGNQLGAPSVISNPNQVGYGQPVTGASVGRTGSPPTMTPTGMTQATQASVSQPAPPPIQYPQMTYGGKSQRPNPLLNAPLTLGGGQASGQSAQLQQTPTAQPSPVPPRSMPASQTPAPQTMQSQKQAGPSLPSSDTPQTNAKISSITSKAIQAGADPAVLNQARQFLGNKDYIGYCEKFVEQVTQGRTGIYGSAIDAWRSQKDKAVPGVQGIQPGDTVYFSPNEGNEYYGHTGVYAGNGKFISATDSGVQQYDLGQWMKQTGQNLLGYIPMAERAIASLPQTVMGILSNFISPKQTSGGMPQQPTNLPPDLVQQIVRTMATATPTAQQTGMAKVQTPDVQLRNIMRRKKKQ